MPEAKASLIVPPATMEFNMSWIHEYPPCVFSTRIQATRKFYTAYFAAEIALDLGWYLSLDIPGCTQRLRFVDTTVVTSHEPNRPGLTYNIAVDRVDEFAATLQTRGVRLLSPLQTFVWGDRGGVIGDPNGILLYLFSEAEPSPEFLHTVARYG